MQSESPPLSPVEIKPLAKKKKLRKAGKLSKITKVGTKKVPNPNKPPKQKRNKKVKVPKGSKSKKPREQFPPPIELEEPIECDICNTTYKNNVAFVLHTIRHSEDGKYCCHLCPYKNTAKYQIEMHVRAHEGTTRYKCEVCDKAFTISSHAVEHKYFHTGEKPFQCEICGKHFMFSRFLASHRRCQHYEILTGKPLVKFDCQICSKHYNSASGLRRHKLSQHNDSGVDLSVLCDICGKRLSSKEKLKFHRRIHTGFKPFGCHVCPKAFTKKDQLIEHVRVHTGEKPHICKYCGRGFTQRTPLRIHERTHSGEKPYICICCGKGFVSKTSLDSHHKSCAGNAVAAAAEFAATWMGHPLHQNPAYDHHGDAPKIEPKFEPKYFSMFILRPTELLPILDYQGRSIRIHAVDEKSTSFFESFEGTEDILDDTLIKNVIMENEPIENLDDQQIVKCIIEGKNCLTSKHSGLPSLKENVGNKILPRNTKSSTAVNINTLIKNVIIDNEPIENLNEQQIADCIIEGDKHTPLEEPQQTSMECIKNQKVFLRSTEASANKIYILKPNKLKRTQNRNLVHPTGKISCKICGKNMHAKSLSKHMKYHDDVPPEFQNSYKCHYCSIDFKTIRDLQNHIELHNTDYFACGLCGENFKTACDWSMHVYKHTKIYYCFSCDFHTRSMSNSIQNHMKRHEGKFVGHCGVCGRGFLAKSTMDCHMETHMGIRRYKCELCDKAFTVENYLKVHKKLNHKKEILGIEEVFQCEVCGRNFTFEKSLVRHLSVIHGIGQSRTVPCPVCKKVIANNHNLMKHMRIHTGEKPFCCEVCGKAFSQVKYLNKHNIVHVKEKSGRLGNKAKDHLSRNVKIGTNSCVINNKE